MNKLQLSVRYVRPDEVDNLRNWFVQVQTVRRDEAIATLIDETVTQETAVLLPNDGRPILIYAMEVDDPVQARRSADSGAHPIDADHRAVLRAAMLNEPVHEVLLDLSSRSHE